MTSNQASEKGQISIHSENILPIIKKWLYSEKEIFLRELIANASDALHKLSRIAMTGEVKQDIPEAKIKISIDKNKKTLTIEDTGIGMTADEVKKYINQVAFSGVKDFVEKYQDKSDSQQIIGHFGLGFYSSYMVAHKVEIETLSYKDGATAVHWSCAGSTEFEMGPSTKSVIGTAITLHLADDSLEMLEEGKVRELLNRYCAFIKFPIELSGEVVNDPKPIWTKNASELNEKDYLDFFHKLFPMQPDPLFWIHLNVDHPFNLRGILYFPKLQHELDASQGQVKLYCNQVFVAENTKELIPEFLTLLKGAIDCPDLPLNVSRSYLQNDPTVQKISQHIVKKVADKLSGMANNERESYQKFWDDIHPFVKYGMLRDEKFYERMADHVLFKTSKAQYVTLNEYQEKNKEKAADSVIYTSDEQAQAALVSLVEEAGIDVLVANTLIDQHFLPYLEFKSNRKFKFQRVDADVSKHLVGEAHSNIVDPNDKKTPKEQLEEIFSKYLERPKVKIKVEALKNSDVSGMLVTDENVRRMRDMSRNGPLAGLQNLIEDEHTLLINQNNPAVKNLIPLSKSFNREDDMKLIVNQVYDLAFLQQGRFTSEMMQNFLKRSAKIMERVGPNA